MTIFYIPNPNLTTTLLTIDKQQIRSLLRQMSWLMVCYWRELDLKIKCDQKCQYIQQECDY